MGTYKPMDATKLTKKQKLQALNSLPFLTKKRDGCIKARKCPIGSKHRDFDGYNKADGSSPAVSTKGIILTAAIDGHFLRDVATIDIPNTFLWADNDFEVLMKLCGKMVNLLVPLDLSLYRKYVVDQKRRTCFIFQVNEGSLWGSHICSPLLQKTTERARRYGLQNQLI